MKFSLTLLLGLTVGAMAQQPEPKVSPTAPKVEVPVPPMSKGGDHDAVAFGPEGVAFPNMTGLEAAQLYEKVSGTKVILSDRIAVAEVSFVMKKAMTNFQAATNLQAALLQRGLALLPSSDQLDLVRLIVSDPKKLSEVKKPHTRFVPRPHKEGSSATKAKKSRTRFVPRSHKK